jgi:hypothetical protein
VIITTRRSSLEASRGSTIQFLSRTPKETRKLQILPHFDESNGCLKHENNQLHNSKRDYSQESQQLESAEIEMVIAISLCRERKCRKSWSR